MYITVFGLLFQTIDGLYMISNRSFNALKHFSLGQNIEQKLQNATAKTI